MPGPLRSTTERNERAQMAVDGTKPAGMASNGVKLDAGKARFDLLPPDALNAVAGVFTFGAEKYAARNWELGMDWGRVYAAQQRHMLAFWGGETHDPETGMLHTAHATFGTLVLTAYQQRSIGADTRQPIVQPSRVPLALTGTAKRSGGRVSLSDADFALLMAAAGQY